MSDAPRFELFIHSVTFHAAFDSPFPSLSSQGSVIIFVDKQEAADELCKTLISASYSSRPLHGGIDQYDRDSTMSDFKSGAVKILIATSVAARGLDVKSLILVGKGPTWKSHRVYL